MSSDEFKRLEEVLDWFVDDNEEEEWHWFGNQKRGIECSVINGEKEVIGEESAVFSLHVIIASPWELVFQCVFEECTPLKVDENLSFEALFATLHREQVPFGTFVVDEEEIALIYKWYVPPTLPAILLREEVNYLIEEVLGTCLEIRPIVIKLHFGLMTLQEATLLVSRSKMGNA